VGIGDPSPPRNLRVTEVLAPENAFRQDPFAITARFAAQGMEGRRVRVRLRERDATGGGDPTGGEPSGEELGGDALGGAIPGGDAPH
jgi:hypothetical protein